MVPRTTAHDSDSRRVGLRCGLKDDSWVELDLTSRAEEITSRCLRASLPELRPQTFIPGSDDFAEFQSALQFFIPSLLVDKYPWWRYESLDGFMLAVARRLGPEEVELIGLCLLISDHAWTPFHLRLRISRQADEVEWLECKLGECGVGNGGLVRTSSGVTTLLYSLEGRLQSIAWAYTITRGS